MKRWWQKRASAEIQRSEVVAATVVDPDFSVGLTSRVTPIRMFDEDAPPIVDPGAIVRRNQPNHGVVLNNRLVPTTEFVDLGDGHDLSISAKPPRHAELTGSHWNSPSGEIAPGLGEASSGQRQNASARADPQRSQKRAAQGPFPAPDVATLLDDRLAPWSVAEYERSSHLVATLRTWLEQSEIRSILLLHDDDVFVSYRTLNRDVVVAVCRILTANGCRVWLDVRRLGKDPANWAFDLAEAISRSTVTLAIVCPDYLRSPWTLFELVVTRIVGRMRALRNASPNPSNLMQMWMPRVDLTCVAAAASQWGELGIPLALDRELERVRSCRPGRRSPRTTRDRIVDRVVHLADKPWFGRLVHRTLADLPAVLRAAPHAELERDLASANIVAAEILVARALYGTVERVTPVSIERSQWVLEEVVDGAETRSLPPAQ